REVGRAFVPRRGGFSEGERAPPRRARLMDVPRRALPPVEDCLGEAASRNWNCSGTFTIEQAQQDSRNCLAGRRRLKEETARAAVAEPGLLVDHDWTIGGLRNEREGIIRLVAGAIAPAG